MKDIFYNTLDQNKAGRENVWRKLSNNELGHTACNSNMKNNEIKLNIEAALDDNVIFSKMQAQTLSGQYFFYKRTENFEYPKYCN